MRFESFQFFQLLGIWWKIEFRKTAIEDQGWRIRIALVWQKLPDSENSRNVEMRGNLDLPAAVLPVHVTSVPDPKNPHALPRVINFIDDSIVADSDAPDRAAEECRRVP